MKSFKRLWLSVAREVLEKTKDGGAKVPFLTTRAGVEVCFMSGICVMTQACADRVEVAQEAQGKWLKEEFKKWPKFSGDIDFPVPSVTNASSKLAFFFCGFWDMWTPSHPYGALRRELLEFLIQEMEKEDEAKWVGGGVDVHP